MPELTDQAASLRAVDERLVATLIGHFSHAAGLGYDPATQVGGQRESLGGLGFGWLYRGLPEILNARRALVIGSGRGFSVACLALGLERFPEARVWFVDPGYETWKVDGRASDDAPGMWTSPERTEAHFRDHLGLANITHLKLRSDAAFRTFREEGLRFDLILIDGDHGYQQSLKDLRHAYDALETGGLLLAHDARCNAWPGVALAVECLVRERPEARHVVLDAYPGLAIIQCRRPLLTIRVATPGENERINAWRVAGDVTPRPLATEPDPRPGVRYDDPCEGLFAMLDGDELIGGFGVRAKSCHGEGADDFIADDGRPRRGYVLYGAVIKPERRGRGLWDLVRSEVLGWTGDEGYYVITKHGLSARSRPYRVERVGRNGIYKAYHILPLATDTARRIEDLKRENETLRRALETVTTSLSWRITAPVRKVLDALRDNGRNR